MGNWCGKNKAVHPLKQESDELARLNERCGKNKGMHPLKQESDELARLNEPLSGNSMRIKVLISKRQLNELMTKTDLSKEDSELGRLILQECFEGNLTARVVGVGNGLVSTDYAVERSLSTIHE